MIFGTFERMVAFRYLRARRQEGFVSVIAIFSLLGIALGVATLIIVMSVMNGFREDLIGAHPRAQRPPRLLRGRCDDERFRRDRGQSSHGARGCQRDAAGRGPGDGDGHRSGGRRRGARHPPDDIRARKLIADHIVAGSLADFADDDIAIGDRLARRLGATVGGKITLISPEGTDTAFGTVPRMKTYTVAALFDVGFYEYDNSFIYMPLDAAQLFFKMPNAVSYLEVFVRNADQSTEIGRAIAQTLGRPVRILDWQRANSSIVNAVEIERNVMFLILTLIIIVAAFNIISGMIMMVKDKGRDIAILRTMGASRGMILRIFMLSGASIGVVGTLAGFGLGLLITKNIEVIRQFLQGVLHIDLFSAEIYFFTRIPAHIDTGEVTAVVVMALALSFLATLYPSWRAARLDPVEGLRYE